MWYGGRRKKFAINPIGNDPHARKRQVRGGEVKKISEYASPAREALGG